ncbi:4-alpha-glucanotransferase [mine drainage metagenome]|uniref:4-alpha-glucanotransferase n=1 Tax=mine drainage metagenome TaxID=410659 RepID=A0A1J5RK93_9ZZZZ
MSAPAQDLLDQLAAKAGIEEGWWDFFGHYRPVPPDTKRAFLEAMGFAVGNAAELADSLYDLEMRPWRRWLEPCRVWPESKGAPVLELAIPEGLEHQTFAWRLDEDWGAVHHGTLKPFDLPMTAEREVDGVWSRRHDFRLPGSPMPGLHRLTLTAPDGRRQSATLIVTPAKAWLPPALAGDEGRAWGIATQLYALRGPDNWGLGDFSDLAGLGRQAAALGAAAVGINPLHALFPQCPDRFSPYSPSARAFLNIAYIDVEAVPDFAESLAARRLFASPGFQARIAAAQNARLVEYDSVLPLKLSALELCWTAFQAGHLGSGDARDAAFAAFRRAGGEGGERFARFQALQEHFLRQDAALGYWRHWPEPYRHPDSPAVAAFAAEKAERVGFYWYLQWLADDQLAQAQAACRAAGMAVGLYRDLGVGIGDDGAEAWGNQDLLCLGVSVGAPPDPLNLAGQDWGLVPFNPLALKEAAYAPLLAVLEANMAHAGAMRLDHAMCLRRLYWVPRGAKADQGAYVRMPAEDLFGLVALVSQRRRCLVIGEDLGTVPDGFREAMAAHGLLGYRLMVFEKTADGAYKAPGDLAREALLAVGTHDLPSLAGWWAGIDLDAREQLALYPDPAMSQGERRGREADRAALRAALVAAGLLADTFPQGAALSEAQARVLAAALYAYLRRAPARLLMAQMEDVLGVSLQMNLPGTTTQHPNWRRRYPAETAAMLADPAMRAVAKRLG